MKTRTSPRTSRKARPSTHATKKRASKSTPRVAKRSSARTPRTAGVAALNNGLHANGMIDSLKSSAQSVKDSVRNEGSRLAQAATNTIKAAADKVIDNGGAKVEATMKKVMAKTKAQAKKHPVAATAIGAAAVAAVAGAAMVMRKRRASTAKAR